MSPAPVGRAVVTGAAGFIGSHLAEALLGAGFDVVGIDAFLPYYDPAVKRANIAALGAHPRFTLLPADLLELDLEEALRPGDRVFHLAAQPGVQASWGSGFASYVRHNVDATQRVLEAAQRVGVGRLVYASSSSVYGDAPMPMDEEGPTRPISPYGVTKLTGEQLCLAYWRGFGLEVVPLRFFTVYGPRQRPDMAFHRFIEAVRTGTPVRVYGGGDQKRDFTHVADVVRTLLAAADRGTAGVPVNVGGGSAVSVNQTLAIIGRLMGRRPRIEHVEVPPGDARDTQAATARLAELEELPRIDIETGLESQIAWQSDGRTNGHRRAIARADRPPVGTDQTVGPLVLYSHDTFGLGHLRRNLSIAHAVLERRPGTRLVMLTGLPVADEWRRQTGIELVSMPTAVKVGAERYRPAEKRSMPGLVAERAGIIASTLLRVRPRAVLIDHAPLGMKGELRLALQIVREQLPETRVVLGLRDVLDEPATVVATWREQHAYDAIESLYDEILVYGSSDLFDVRKMYQLPVGMWARTTFTGYIGKAPSMELEPAGESWPENAAGGPRFLVTGGGGGDGAELLRTFLAAWPAVRDVTGGTALLVAGPRMTPAERAKLGSAVAVAKAVRILDFSPRMLSLISGADIVVSMGGYNTVVEGLAAHRPMVLMPRVRPRREQLIRARLLERLGLARVVLPGAGAIRTLAAAILDTVAAGPLPPETWKRVDLAGRDRAAAALLRA